MRRIAALALLAISVPLLLSACGGGESDEDQIRDTVEEIVAATKPDEIKQACNELLSQRFIGEVYRGDIKACVETPVNDETGVDDPGETQVDSVTVDGSAASVGIVAVGGDTEGIEGTWTMADENGQWKLDRLEDDYLRTSFDVSVQTVDGGMLTYEPMRECMGKQAKKLDAATIRKVTYESARGEKSKALDVLNKMAEDCPHQLAGYLADTLAREVVAKKKVPPAKVECARKEMAPLLELTGLAPNALHGNNEFGDATSFALAGIIAGAVKACSKG